MATDNHSHSITVSVPSIHSSDRDERIAARRTRIQTRLEQKRKSSESSKGIVENIH